MAMLEVNNLSIQFGGLRAVDGFNMTIEKGQLYGLIGPNGAGKTTVFNLLTGVYKPTEGIIKLDGQDITGKSTIEINKAGIARTFQNIRLFKDMPVLDNVKVGLHNHHSYSTLTGILRLPKYHKVEKEMNEKAMEILKKLTAEENIPEKYYHAVFDAEVAGIPCIVSKTGYTGEDGVELYLASEKAEEMWDALLEAGKEEGLVPCGLGARDTLRMEAAMPLYGHEMNDEITPLETGLKFAVKMAKNDFIGKSALEEKGTPSIKRIGLKVTGRGIIREHQDVYVGDKKIGHTTSGTHCPYLGYPIAMALVDADSVEIGDTVEADVRGRRVAAEVVALPFYKREK